MAGASDSLEHFKNRLPLADIIGRYVKLTRHGREYQGLCPFHQEKTPSFSVAAEKGFYHCFGCGAHGDAISFISNIEGLSFPDALQRLADITGIEAPARRAEPDKVSPGLLDANAAACRFFQEQLSEASGAAARRYVNGRGLENSSVETFQLGYAPLGRDSLKRWLAARGIPEASAIEAGLLIKPDDGSPAYDRFRDRLMIAIEDHRGRVVGFGGRALGDQKAKYLNSPETPVFHKGQLLYNLKRASVPARQKDRLIVVEGYMDVIALAEGGFPEAVAPLGTAVTEEQLQLLWRVCDKPTICLDGDRAGQAAALKVARRALGVMKSGNSLNFVLLPQGEDPDSLIRSQGANTLNGLLRTALPLSRLVWTQELNSGPANTPEELAALRHRLFDYVNATADHALKQALKDQFFALLNARRPQNAAIYRRNGPARKGGPSKGGPSNAGLWEGTGRLGASLQMLEARGEYRLLGYFLADSTLLHAFEETLAHITFTDSGAEKTRQEILNWYAGVTDLDDASLQHHLSAHGCEKVVALAHSAVPSSGETSAGERNTEITHLFETLRISAATQQGRDELAEGIKSVEASYYDSSRRALDHLVNPKDGDDAV